MHNHTKRLSNGSDERKFKRNSLEIVKSKERTGCCDSCTLFTSLARSAEIPTMQIIALKKKWGEELDKGVEKGTDGHYYAAVYLKDIKGNSDCFLIDPDEKVNEINDVKIRKLNTTDRNIDDFYIFAYVRDYYDDLGIDSIKKMTDVQISVYRECNIKDFTMSNEDI